MDTDKDETWTSAATVHRDSNDDLPADALTPPKILVRGPYDRRS